MKTILIAAVSASLALGPISTSGPVVYGFDLDTCEVSYLIRDHWDFIRETESCTFTTTLGIKIPDVVRDVKDKYPPSHM